MSTADDLRIDQLRSIESKAKSLDPTFSSWIDLSSSSSISEGYRRATDFISEYQKRQEVGQAIGQSVRDLQGQIRSEIGEDGGETYFESYTGIVYCGIVNIKTDRIENNNFLLGSTTGAGILGSNLFSYTAGSTRFTETNSIQDLDESFTATTYQDATTTAQGWGQGSLVFTTPGSTLAVFSSWKSGSFESTTFNRIRIEPTFGSYNPAISFQASFNGGSNYTTIYPLIEKTLAYTGSDFRLRIEDTSGSVVLDNIYITTKGDNFV